MSQRVRLAIFATLVLCQCALFAASAPPRFEDYPAADAYRGKNAALVLGKGDQQFRTRLLKASTEQPNFARHYILTAWGCGAGCLVSALIDANTGHVYWAPHTICCWALDEPDDFRPIEVRADSRLVIFHGERNENEGDDGAHYYEFTGGNFVFLTSLKETPRERH
jgi:hypothetical protein